MRGFEGGSGAAQRRRGRSMLVRRAGEMLLRGLLRKPFLGRSSGPLFIGRRTRVTGCARSVIPAGW